MIPVNGRPYVSDVSMSSGIELNPAEQLVLTVRFSVALYNNRGVLCVLIVVRACVCARVHAWVSECVWVRERERE